MMFHMPTSANTRQFWEPVVDEGHRELPPRGLRRVQKDLLSIVTEPPEGVFPLPDEEDVKLVRLLVSGPDGTPYQGGLFLFLVDLTADYPLRAPRVKCLTTDSGRVRFNPNIYRDGKVCLSILGTFAGPSWSPAITLSGLAVSIRSLLVEAPYRNEPGRESEAERKKRPGEEERYSLIIRHETIRVAACDLYEGRDSLPEPFRSRVVESVKRNRDYFVAVCRESRHLDGSDMDDPFGESRGRFRFGSLLERISGYDL